METFYQDDAEMIAVLSAPELEAFTTFIEGLETIMDEWGVKHGQRPYTKPLAKGTGLSCWKDAFDDGLSPRQAFEEDRDDWEWRPAAPAHNTDG